MYTLKKLKKIVKKAKKKDGVFELNLLNFMECSLPAFVYRASFLPNMFESLNYIKSNNIAVNKIFKCNVSYIVKPMDLVTFRI
jgi:ribosomal protein S4